jgi:CheY-like chemotaxis protein
MLCSKALEVLFSQRRSQILCALFRDPERWWSLPELAGRLGFDSNGLRQQVRSLSKSGILREKQESGRALVQPDPANPIFSELQSIVAKFTPGTETILIVEDQPATAQITRILLESWGYQVLEAHNGREAVEIFDTNGDRIQLILLDVIMPEMSGSELARELLRRKPRMRIIFMSGYPTEDLNSDGVPFLSKPFNPASLSRIIRKELDRPDVT